MKNIKKTLSIIICLSLLLSLSVSAFAADYQHTGFRKLDLRLNGESFPLKALDASYTNNTYVSLRSLAEALDGTSKQFNIEFNSTPGDGDYFAITTGGKYTVPDKSLDEETIEEDIYLSLYRNRLFKDGNELRYYTYRFGDPEDLYMSLTDIQLVFDFLAFSTDGKILRLYPDKPFSVSFRELKNSGYFDVINSVLVGDSKSGKIIFSSRADESFPVASTSKLMSYVLIREALERGEISLEDQVVLSSNAVALSKSEDGLITMAEGQTAPVSELITGMLVASSNECALALAEHVAGSEESFVQAMNYRAAELGLTGSEFINCNGLPKVSAGTIPVKRQNKMTAEDLFILASYILNSFPDITNITSQQFASMKSLDYTTANSNPLVFNIGATGLKTGSTIASGQCVVACDGSGKIVIVLGAEDGAIRGRAAELLFKAK